METGQGSVINALHQRDGIRDELLRDRCRDTSKHQEGGLDGIMRFYEYCPLLVGFRTRLWRKDEAIMPIVVVWTAEEASIITLHEGIISLSFYILECCKKTAIAKRILQQR